MDDPKLISAIVWWILRKRRSYIRPAHYQAAQHRSSFAPFWRYYNSPEEKDMVRFLRLSRKEFNAVHSEVGSLSFLLALNACFGLSFDGKWRHAVRHIFGQLRVWNVLLFS